MGNRITVWSALLGGVLAIASAAPVFSQQPAAETPPLLNASFESPEVTTAENDFPPESWICFASKPGDKAGCTAKVKRTGSQSLAFKAPSAANAFEGASQELVVTPSNRYGFTAYAIGDESDKLGAGSIGQVHIEWRSADGKEISRVYGPTWDLNISSMRWERFFVEGEAPGNAASGLVVIMFYSKSSPGIGTFYVDDCEFTATPSKSASLRRDPGTRMNSFPGTNMELRKSRSGSR
jgi:hypothetical protein